MTHSTLRTRAKRLLTLVVALGAASVASAAGQAAPDADGIRRVPRPIPGRYVVVLRPGADAPAVGAAARSVGLASTIDRVYSGGLRGFALGASAQAARALARDPRVLFVEEDGVVELSHRQQLLDEDSWGLDRIDQRSIKSTRPSNG